MKFSRRESVAAIAAGTAALSTARARGAVARPPSPLMLWYEQPASVWTEALPVGNGRMGAMVFGGIRQERLQLNESTLWAGQPYDPVNPAARAALSKVRALIFEGKIAEAEALANDAVLATPSTQMPYQAFCDLMLDFPGLGQTSNYRRSLDLDSAMTTTRFTADGIDHKRQVIASADDQVIAMRVTASGEGQLNVDIGLASPHKIVAVEADGSASLLMTGRNGDAAGINGGLQFAARPLPKRTGGRIEPGAGGRLLVRGADAV
ncbi:glycoside hydrolase family 95 protein, partial [Sphingobium sp. ba1]|uniref:glycoside hydrolase family 95 protein n=1 Tax=Sphingobium sp. ba1 TaxID=1522072 RepID=UPI00138DDCDA